MAIYIVQELQNGRQVGDLVILDAAISRWQSAWQRAA